MLCGAYAAAHVRSTDRSDPPDAGRMGDEPAGMVLRGGMVVSTATRELYPADVVISGERIAAVAAPGEYPSGAAEEVDLDGRFVARG